MELQVEKREILGSKVKQLRHAGQVPAVIFGQGKPSVPVVVGLLEFTKVYQEVGESQMIDLQLKGGESKKVLVTEVQIHPVTDEFLHVNFHELKMTEKITATAPIKIIGEAPVVKSGGGILLTLLDEVEVECLPTDLPPEIQVDVSGLTEVDQSIVVKDLPVDRAKVVIQQRPEDLVVKIDHAQMAEELEEEVVEEAAAVAQVEATEEKVEATESEGEKPKEDQKGGRGEEKREEKKEKKGERGKS